MKAKIYILCLFLAVILGYTSCNKSETCSIGYEGEDCKTLSILKYIDYWKGVDRCGAAGDYEIYMQIKQATVTSVTLHYIPAFGESIAANANIDANGNLIIEEQNTDPSGYQKIAGTVVFSNDSLKTNITYTTQSNGVSNSCAGAFGRNK